MIQTTNNPNFLGLLKTKIARLKSSGDIIKALKKHIQQKKYSGSELGK